MIISKHLQKEIEYHLRCHDEDMAALEQIRADTALSSPDPYSSPRVRTGPGDPTARAVIETERRTHVLSGWIKAVEESREHFANTPFADLYRLLYDKPWVPVQTAAIRLCMSHVTAYRWRENIVLYTALLAVQHGALRISG